jgi:hypothetical protein
MVVGFSTGSLAFQDFRMGLQMVQGEPTAAIELSALREVELQPLVEALDSLDLDQFSYVSFHAPSKLAMLSERSLIEILGPVINREWPIIVHPDIITDFEAWRALGESLCIENMDKRKSVGRTTSELRPFFDELTEAGLCFDIGHARQVDPTMCEAENMLEAFQGRIRQIHLSLVNSNSVHEPLNYESIIAYQRVAHLIRRDVPVILETPVSGDRLRAEIRKAESLLGGGANGSH